MIKQKAPKDMTAVEFVAHLEMIASKEMLAKNLEGWSITLQGLRKELSEPAPNPFTPDQLAWMREEQRSGYKYAAIDFDGEVRFFDQRPMRDCTHWNKVTGSESKTVIRIPWLAGLLSVNDEEPLCFADYAPLEGADHV